MKTSKIFTHSFSPSELEQIIQDFLQYEVEDGKISFKWKHGSRFEGYYETPIEYFDGLEVTVCKP